MEKIKKHHELATQKCLQPNNPSTRYNHYQFFPVFVARWVESSDQDEVVLEGEAALSDELSGWRVRLRWEDVVDD